MWYFSLENLLYIMSWSREKRATPEELLKCVQTPIGETWHIIVVLMEEISSDMIWADYISFFHLYHFHML